MSDDEWIDLAIVADCWPLALIFLVISLVVAYEHAKQPPALTCDEAISRCREQGTEHGCADVKTLCRVKP